MVTRPVPRPSRLASSSHAPNCGDAGDTGPSLPTVEPPGPVPWTEEDPDADFRVEPNETNEDILGFYREECAHSREVAAKASLDDLAAAWPVDRPPERRPTLRWIYVHMIEETARHAGHLDVVREMIDGKTGD